MSEEYKPNVIINKKEIEDVKVTLELNYENQEYYLILDSPYFIIELDTVDTEMFECKGCTITNVNIGNVDKRFVHIVEVDEIKIEDQYIL